MQLATINGRLGADITLRDNVGDNSLAEFDVAVSYYDFKTREQATNWWTVQVWGKQAEYLARNGQKGDVVCVSGETTQNHYLSKKYTDANGVGAPMTKVYIKVNGSGGCDLTFGSKHVSQAAGPVNPDATGEVGKDEIPF